MDDTIVERMHRDKLTITLPKYAVYSDIFKLREHLQNEADVQFEFRVGDMSDGVSELLQNKFPNARIIRDCERRIWDHTDIEKCGRYAVVGTRFCKEHLKECLDNLSLAIVDAEKTVKARRDEFDRLYAALEREEKL